MPSFHVLLADVTLTCSDQARSAGADGAFNNRGIMPLGLTVPIHDVICIALVLDFNGDLASHKINPISWNLVSSQGPGLLVPIRDA